MYIRKRFRQIVCLCGLIIVVRRTTHRQGEQIIRTQRAIFTLGTVLLRVSASNDNVSTCLATRCYDGARFIVPPSDRQKILKQKCYVH